MNGAKLSALAIKHIENKYGGYVINVMISGKNGVPDLIACIEGKFFAFEIKGDKDTTKFLQDEHLARVSKSNGYGGYVYSLSDIDKIVNNMIKPCVKLKKSKTIFDL